MIDHLGFNVSDIKAARAFYDQALAPLGVEVVMEVSPEETPNGQSFVGYGKAADGGDIQAGKPSLWIGDGSPLGNRVHVAILADGEAQVQAFHRAALAAGGRDNGAPGLRPQYHPGYYAAFVLDPDGHNIEAVFHRPQG